MTPRPNISLSDQSSGSSSGDEPVFLAVGKLRRPHGVRGEIILSVWTDFPERLSPGLVVRVGSKHLPLRIKGVRPYQQGLLVTFEGYDDREQVGELRNHTVYVLAEDRPPLPEGEYYLHELLGLDVIRDEDDVHLGVVVEILETGANDVFVVRGEGSSDLLLPDIDEVILGVDLERKEMRVHLIPGLLMDT